MDKNWHDMATLQDGMKRDVNPGFDSCVTTMSSQKEARQANKDIMK